MDTRTRSCCLFSEVAIVQTSADVALSVVSCAKQRSDLRSGRLDGKPHPHGLPREMGTDACRLIDLIRLQRKNSNNHCSHRQELPPNSKEPMVSARKDLSAPADYGKKFIHYWPIFKSIQRTCKRS